MFNKGSNVAKKMDVWVQKELRDSQYRGCTVAYKENNVYNICVKPRENKIDAMPLSGDSESGIACWVRTCKTGESRSSRRSTESRSSRRSTGSRSSRRSTRSRSPRRIT